jgi:hypothetical protein
MQLVGALGPGIDKHIEVARSDSGSFEVQGVVSTRQDRSLIESALRPLMASRQISVDIHSNEDIRPATDIPTASAQPDSDPAFPLQPILRSALSTHLLPATTVNEETLKLAETAISEGASAHRETWHLLQLSALLLNPTGIRSMNPQDRSLWLTLLRQHQTALAHNLQIIRTTLAPIFVDNPASFAQQEEENQVIRNPEELAAFARHLNDVSERLSTALTENLTVPLDGPPPPPSPQHLQELLQRNEADNRRLGITLGRLAFFDPAKQR